MKTAQTSCRLCGSSRYRIIGRETPDKTHFTIARCIECSLVYVRETYAQVSPEYREMSDEDINPEHIRLQNKHKERAFRKCLELVRSFNQTSLPEPLVRRLLDVGCGVGGWLQFAKSEYECYGFDASPVQSRYASRHFSNVRCANSLSEYQAQLNSAFPDFDLITLWDVLEHIRRPVKFMVELSHSLSSSGLLFASVPAAKPMVVKNRLLSFGWPKSRFSWSPREHVAYYTPKTLLILCEKVDLQVLRIGAVALYPRPMSAFELVRRLGFFITSAVPDIAPQIYVLAKRKRQA